MSERVVLNSHQAARVPHVVIAKGLLWRVINSHLLRGKKQLVVPSTFRVKVLQRAHSHPWAGHQGKARTPSWVLEEFFWPQDTEDVKEFCRSCPQCQVAIQRSPAKAPLTPKPIITTPFERIAMDFVGPLPWSARDYCYLLVIMAYATRHSEAIPLKGIQVPGVAQALLRFFSRLGLPQEILTDRGATFTSTLMKQLCQALGIRQLFTTVYHPQTDGLVERMNQSIINMLWKTTGAFPGKWDRYIGLLLFDLRETPQTSTGVAPFELVFGRKLCGVMQTLREE